ncbi:hypothetical protein B0H14DRAFT_3516970 [Mycena olivaceomarginata]|nr:hypothetical protein B0H14DRAFT_3516970 [Mycena olivaceomarginata]
MLGQSVETPSDSSRRRVWAARLGGGVMGESEQGPVMLQVDDAQANALSAHKRPSDHHRPGNSVNHCAADVIVLSVIRRVSSPRTSVPRAFPIWQRSHGLKPHA